MTENLKSGGIFKRVFRIASALYSAIAKSIRTSVEAAPPELKKGAKKLLLGALATVIIISSVKYILFKREELARRREIEAGPIVRVAKVIKSPGEHKTTVIGETRPYQSATLYAKVSGYLKVVKVDKGDLVKKGQVLAVIESPETDQAYAAAFANARNKKSIAARIETLKKRNLISQQEADQATSDDDVASAQLRAEETLKGYEIIRAPFDGTVTARFADPGALVQNATNGQTGALPVVTVSEIKRLRVDVFLDQRDAPFIEKDAPVEITLSERPGLKIEGRVDRLSDQLDSRTKMMLTEIDIPNDQGVLVSGSFVQVSMNIKSPPYVEAPVESLVLKDDKSYITVVSPSNQLNYRPIEIATNDGKMVWIMSGIKEGESVALNVGTTIPEGAKVRPMEEPVKPPVSPSPSVAPPPVQSSPAPDASPAPLAPALAPLHQKSSTNVGQDNKSL